MRCQRVSLIKKDGCFICKGNFILDSSKPDSYLSNMKKYNQQKINKQKQKKYENELLQHQEIDQRT